MPRHILVLPITEFGSCDTHFRACDTQILGIIHLFGERNGLGQGQKRQKEASSTFHTAWNPFLSFNIFGCGLRGRSMHDPLTMLDTGACTSSVALNLATFEILASNH